MAIVTIVNGDSQPVFNLDTQNGPVDPTTAYPTSVPTQPQGPKLDFFRLVAANTMATQTGVNEFVGNVIRGIQQLGTVAVYQVDTTALSIALYPTGYSTAEILAAGNVATVAGVNQLDSCTNVGFKLTT
jgi:hypothetical protein